MIWNVRILYGMKNIFSVLLFLIYLYLQNRGGPLNVMWRRYGIPVKDNLSLISQRFKLNSCLSLEWLLIALSCASLRKRNISDYSRGKWSKITFLRRGKKWQSGQEEWVREQILKERVGAKKMTKKTQVAEVKTKEGDGEEEWECLWRGSNSVLWKELLLGFYHPSQVSWYHSPMVYAQSWAGLRRG